MMDRETFFERARRRQLQYASAKHLRVLPCPLCGAIAELTIFGDTWFVECKAFDDCGACGPIRPTPDTAAIAWNRRYPSSSPFEDTPAGTDISKMDRGFCRTCGDPMHYIGNGTWQHTTPGHNHQAHLG